MAAIVEDRILILVFVTAELPVETLNLLIERGEELDREDHAYQFVDSVDVDTLRKSNDSSNPVGPDFVSPVLGWSHEQVKNWFIANIQQKPHILRANEIFLILDQRTLPQARLEAHSRAKDETRSMDHDGEDENDIVDTETILLCSVQSRLFKKVRCDFWAAKSNACYLEYHNMPDDMREGALGICWRSGIICTEERFSLLSKRGMSMVKGIPTIQQDWRDFAHEWRDGGPNDISSPESSDDESERE